MLRISVTFDMQRSLMCIKQGNDREYGVSSGKNGSNAWKSKKNPRKRRKLKNQAIFRGYNLFQDLAYVLDRQLRYNWWINYSIHREKRIFVDTTPSWCVYTSNSRPTCFLSWRPNVSGGNESVLISDISGPRPFCANDAFPFYSSASHSRDEPNFFF